MTTNSKVCGCGSCAGATCTCGCQNVKTERRAGCRCGAVCTCGATCSCGAARNSKAPRLESKRLLAGLLGATVLSASVASAEAPRTCGTATLRDVEAVTEILPADSHTRVVARTNKRGEREMDAYTYAGERHDTTYMVTVEFGDMSYTARSAGNFWNFNPTRLVINDPIGICVDRTRIMLRRPDGKDYKATIVRAVRTQASH